METVIICSEKNENMEPVTSGTPLALCRVLDKPILGHFMANLKSQGIDTVTLAVPEKSGAFLNRLEELSQGVQTRIMVSEGDSDLKILRKVWSGGDVLCVKADHMSLFNVEALLKFHVKSSSGFTPAVVRSDSPWESIAVTLDGRNRITRIQPRPSAENCCTEFTMSGVFAVSGEALSDVPLDTRMSAAEYFSALVSRKELDCFGYQEKGWHYEFSEPEDLLGCNISLLEEKAEGVLDKMEISSGIYGESVKGLRGVSLIPPVFLGKNVSVGMGSVIGPGAVLCDNVSVGGGCHIKNSYLGEESRAADGVVLNGATICRGAKLKKGVECERLSVIGARTSVGENTVVKSGVRVWDGKEVSPGLTVTSDVKEMRDGELRFDDEGSVEDLSGFFTPAMAASLGMASGTAIKKQSVVIVGYSGGPGAKALSDSVCSGLASTGVNVWKIGESTGGQLFYAMNKAQAEMGIMVTAGAAVRVSLYAQGGLKPGRAVEREIERRINSGSFRGVDPGGYGNIVDASSLKDLYERRLMMLLPQKLRSINVKVRTSDKLAAQAADRLFYPRNDLSGQEVTFHLNPDSGGLTAYTEKAGYVFQEKLTMIVMEKALENGENAAVPFTFPDAAEKLAAGKRGKVFRYLHSSDGSDSSARAIAALEENLYIRDPLELAVRVAARLSEDGRGLDRLIKKLPEFYCSQRFVAAELTPPEMLMRLDCQTSSGESEVCGSDGSRAVVRPVRNGGGLMIFAQAQKAEVASALCDEIESKVLKRN